MWEVGRGWSSWVRWAIIIYLVCFTETFGVYGLTEQVAGMNKTASLPARSTRGAWTEGAEVRRSVQDVDSYPQK